MSNTELIGQRIKRERLNLSLTQRDLARRVSVGAPHISKIEAGRESPSDELLKEIAEVMGCSYDELLIVARRLPSDLMEKLASNPQQSISFLRRWNVPES